MSVGGLPHSAPFRQTELLSFFFISRWPPFRFWTCATNSEGKFERVFLEISFCVFKISFYFFMMSFCFFEVSFCFFEISFAYTSDSFCSNCVSVCPTLTAACFVIILRSRLRHVGIVRLRQGQEVGSETGLLGGSRATSPNQANFFRLRVVTELATSDGQQLSLMSEPIKCSKEAWYYTVRQSSWQPSLSFRSLLTTPRIFLLRSPVNVDQPSSAWSLFTDQNRQLRSLNRVCLYPKTFFFRFLCLQSALRNLC